LVALESDTFVQLCTDALATGPFSRPQTTSLMTSRSRRAEDDPDIQRANGVLTVQVWVRGKSSPRSASSFARAQPPTARSVLVRIKAAVRSRAGPRDGVRTEERQTWNARVDRLRSESGERGRP